MLRLLIIDWSYKRVNCHISKGAGGLTETLKFVSAEHYFIINEAFQLVAATPDHGMRDVYEMVMHSNEVYKISKPHWCASRRLFRIMNDLSEREHIFETV